MEIFGIPHQAFLGQLMLGLVNGAFYAMLSLGLAVIFGLLDIVNFAHGALYMVGAFLAAWLVAPPCSVMMPAARFMIGTQSGSVRSAMRPRMSPGLAFENDSDPVMAASAQPRSGSGVWRK